MFVKNAFLVLVLLQVSQMFKWYNLYRQNKLKQNFLQTLRIYRWFRNLRHYLNTQEILEKHNVSWNAVSQQ
ncbi:hypothetical protein EfmJHP10_22890 [Enterococcus faecium]|nr:hypothetical protein EfmJHP10_22890 [Enterococcus faecium]